MLSTVSTSLDATTLTALLAQCERTGTDLSTTIAHAVASWLASHAADKGADSTDAVANDAGLCRGYQWKTVYLPEGTLLRRWSHGDCRDAQVIGGRIMLGGTSVSPNQFARSCARSVRNAWKDLMVKRPGDTAFHSASRLRRELAAHVEAPPVDKKVAKKAAKKALRKADRKAGRDARNAVAQGVSVPPSPLEPARSVTPGSGWDLPERRKLRYRLEDVAFE